MQTKDDAPVEAGLAAQLKAGEYAARKWEEYAGQADARIEALEAADRENSELLEAAIEGQSYWQARAERFEAALLDISSATPDWLAEHGGAERLVDRALEALADAQQTQKPEEVRDA